MNLFEQIQGDILAAIKSLVNEGKLPQDLDTSKITAEPPRESSHGDIATNAAMVLSKQAGMNPRALADLLKERLCTQSHMEKVEVAGPGFINISLSSVFWSAQLRGLLQEGPQFGRSYLGENKKIGVEFLSANPTGPLHIGHTRGAVLGDSLVRILKFSGYNVRGDYYINDAGGQVAVLAQSVYLRYKEALGHDIGTIPEGLYPGEYLKPLGEALAKEFGSLYVDKDQAEWLDLFRERSVQAMMTLIHADLEVLGVKHDVFTSEKKLVDDGKPQEAFNHLKELGLIYEGTLEAPKGMDTTDWVPQKQMIFKATDFGDDKDRVLVKADGTFTYLMPDISYHYAKYKQGLEAMINILGEDHIGYVNRIKAATSAVTDGKINLEVMITQIVNLLRDGEPVKMSKRSGNIVTLRELIDEVGRDAVRFSMLMRRHDVVMDVDLKKVVEQSKENPIFYVQYAHARCASVLRTALDAFPNLHEDLDKGESILDDEAEISVIKFLATWPRFVRQAAEGREPHRIAYYLTELAAQFHALWNKGKDASHLRFIHENDLEKTKSKLLLVQGVKNVLNIGLGLMGVDAVERM